MRAFWIALLIALLPLRGWVGDSMAVSMIALPHATSMSAAMPGPADHGADHVGSDHSHHASEASEDSPMASTHGDHGQTSTHLLCEVCNGPVLSTFNAPIEATPLEHTLLIARSERFASLAPRHPVKPPIA
jgi:hypothetical protein